MLRTTRGCSSIAWESYVSIPQPPRAFLDLLPALPLPAATGSCASPIAKAGAAPLLHAISTTACAIVLIQCNFASCSCAYCTHNGPARQVEQMEQQRGVSAVLTVVASRCCSRRVGCCRSDSFSTVQCIAGSCPLPMLPQFAGLCCECQEHRCSRCRPKQTYLQCAPAPLCSSTP